MKILVTGANGMVARAVIAHCRLMGDDVAAFTRQELDIADRDAVLRTFESETPKAAINCAAYTNVDGAESNEAQCFAVNSDGPENLAAASKNAGATFVTISTDYVFDGEKEGFYAEDDPPNPQSVYARSKLEGEPRALAEYPESIVVRTGWVYGNGGTNFLSKIGELLAGGQCIKALYDSFGTPTYAADLAVRLRDLAASQAKGIFHVTNAGPGTSYLEFAQAVAELANLDSKLIQPVSRHDLQRPAPRPANSRLVSVRINKIPLEPLRDWRSALREFLG